MLNNWVANVRLRKSVKQFNGETSKARLFGGMAFLRPLKCPHSVDMDLELDLLNCHCLVVAVAVDSSTEHFVFDSYAFFIYFGGLPGKQKKETNTSELLAVGALTFIYIWICFFYFTSGAAVPNKRIPTRSSNLSKPADTK